MANQNNDYIVGSVVKAFKILECFSENKPSATPQELAKELNLNPSSIWRLIQTLEHIGYLEKVEENYRLSYKFLNYTKIILNTTNLRKEALPHLEDLAEKTELNVSMGILDSYKVLYLIRIPSPRVPDTYFHVGRRVPLFCTALGKVLLTYQSEKQREDIFNHLSFKKFTTYTITDKEELLNQLNDIKTQGFAEDNHEYLYNSKCVAVPIWDHTGNVVASISIADRTAINTNRNIKEHLEELFITAKIISNELGQSLFNPMYY